MALDWEERLRALRAFPRLPVPAQTQSAYIQLSICLAPDFIHEAPSMLSELQEKLRLNGIPAFYDLYTAGFVEKFGCTAHLYIPAPITDVMTYAEEIHKDWGRALLIESDLPARKKIADGLFYGEVRNAKESFSKSRGDAVHAAILKSETEGYLAERLEESFREAGVDPRFPERLINETLT